MPRQPLVALAQWMHEFCHRTEAREMELWHRLGHAQHNCLKWSREMANCQQEMANEFDRFMERLSDFINREINQFG